LGKAQSCWVVWTVGQRLSLEKERKGAETATYGEN
jgi:hypothetical protein